MTIETIDVSMYQAPPYRSSLIDWQAVKDAGTPCAIAKATEAWDYEDPSFARNWEEMLRVGIPVPGAYHFGRPDLGSSPQVEADHFVNVVTRLTGNATGCLLGLDAESAGGSAAWCLAFLDHMRDRLDGYHGALYSYLNWMQTRNLTSEPRLGQDYWLWFAWPDSNGSLPNTSPWADVSMQQYGSGGLTGGDLNRFFGDLDQLKRLTVGGLDMTQEEHDVLMAVKNMLTFGNSRPAAHDGDWLWGISDGTPGGDRLSAILAKVQTPPTIDAVAVAAALLPHLPAGVDQVKLVADLEAALPGLDAAAVMAAFKAQLAKP